MKKERWDPLGRLVLPAHPGLPARLDHLDQAALHPISLCYLPMFLLKSRLHLDLSSGQLEMSPSPRIESPKACRGI